MDAINHVMAGWLRSRGHEVTRSWPLLDDVINKCGTQSAVVPARLEAASIITSSAAAVGIEFGPY